MPPAAAIVVRTGGSTPNLLENLIHPGIVLQVVQIDVDLQYFSIEEPTDSRFFWIWSSTVLVCCLMSPCNALRCRR